MTAETPAGARSIRRLLIANRGEIAARIARTAHRLGIGTVGVYSDADADALHVDSVDVAVRIGGAAPADSYLRGDLLIQVALDHGADAVHPGYGFLAERPDFARAVIDAGLVWVGPTPDQIELLGDKVRAKQLAVEAGVPTTPVIEVEGETPDDIPLPALVKAAAGGGGRGRRVLRAGDDVADALASASREAATAFGDGRVFIEPLIEPARHVEVQILGDAHGNVVHLGERECSIQRRNQKVVEEAPSPGIDAETRAALCEGALALARHVGYESSGTVEFLVGADGTITFLEVNTRLQVEHPVTEAVTGLDLVELQLRVATGEVLGITQDEIRCDGHAIEVRLVAEDPVAGWMPSTGTVEAFDFDDELVRVDSGVRAGSVVGAAYDSLLAKLIAHAPSRAEAAAVLARAVRGGRVTGLRTNADCLATVLVEADFLAGQTYTGYLDDHPEVSTTPVPSGPERVVHLLAAVAAERQSRRSSDDVWGFAPAGWRNLPTIGSRALWLDASTGDVHPVEVQVPPYGPATDDELVVRCGAWPEPTEDGSLTADDRIGRSVRVRADDDAVAIEIDGVARSLCVSTEDGETFDVVGKDGSTTWTLQPRFADHDASAIGAGPVSPLPGTVLSVHVTAGDEVSEGQLLVVVEAMKMEHKITAPADATVLELKVAVGDRVDAGDLLVELGGEPA